MKQICLYFEIHQPIHLKRYRFFDIGKDHYYYDDYENERAIQETSRNSYIPALTAMLDMAKKDEGFKVAFSLSGTAIEMLEQYAPEVIDLLQQLAETKCVEFLAEPYSHGLASIGNEESFREEVQRQAKKMHELFGQTPKVVRNSSLIYSDEIGAVCADMGFKGMMAEGAKHILGWKSPHYVYSCAQDNRLSLLMRDYNLSDDISLRFGSQPITADTYCDWIAGLPEGEDVINIFMELVALGIFQPLSTGILEFFKALPACARARGLQFATPSEIIAKHKAVAPMECVYPVSWNDEERDTSCWLGNTMQREAFAKLYDEKVVGRILACKDRRIKADWDRLQASNNFRFMTTKPASANLYRGIYENAFDAFTNYMNILGDFLKRVRDLFSDQVENDELNALYTQITNLGEELSVKENEVSRLRARLEKYESKEKAEAAAEEKPAEKPAAKPAAKKSAAKPAAKKPAAKKTEAKKK